MTSAPPQQLAGSEDPKPEIEAACADSHHCSGLKSRLETCTTRIENGEGHPGETCVEEFFDMMECVNHCAAPKLWSVLQ